VPIGIAPFNSISGNIDTKSVAIYSFLNNPSKNSPKISDIFILLKNFFEKVIPFT
jgi:hypothetical protein